MNDESEQSSVFGEKVDLIRQFPRYLRQRALLLENPHLAVTPPPDFLGWLPSNKFARRTILYILIFCATPKFLAWIFGIEASPTVSLVLTIAEWLIPFILVANVYVSVWWVKSTPRLENTDIPFKFQKMYLAHAVAAPFWFFMAMGAIVWFLVICTWANATALSSSFAPLLYLFLAAFVPILIILPMETAVTVPRAIGIPSGPLPALALCMNCLIFIALQIAVGDSVFRWLLKFL